MTQSQDSVGGGQECVYLGIACHCLMHQVGVVSVTEHLTLSFLALSPAVGSSVPAAI